MSRTPLLDHAAYFILPLGITKGLNCYEAWIPVHETLLCSTMVCCSSKTSSNLLCLFISDRNMLYVHTLCLVACTFLMCAFFCRNDYELGSVHDATGTRLWKCRKWSQIYSTIYSSLLHHIWVNAILRPGYEKQQM